MAAAPVQLLTGVAMPSDAPLPKLWHWESELLHLQANKTHCQAPQSIPALGLFLFDDFQNIYVIELTHQKAQLRKAIPVKDNLYGWTQAEGQLFVVDGTVLSSYELAEGEVTLAAELNLYDGPGDLTDLYASLRLARQREVWRELPWQLYGLLMDLSGPRLPSTMEQPSAPAGIPNEWFSNPRVSIAKAMQTTSEEADSTEPLAMPRPPLAEPPKSVPRAELEGDLSTALLLAILDVLHVLGYDYRPELDAPTLCAYLQDHPLELRLWSKFFNKQYGNSFQDLPWLWLSIPAKFSTPVLKKNAEGFRDNLFVLRSDGVILGCNSSLQQARADKSVGPGTVTKYRGTGTQAMVEAGLTFVNETQTLFYISSDKGLCSVSLQGKAPQSFLPSTGWTTVYQQGIPSSTGIRIQSVAVADGSGDQVWASLPALCGFSAGASGGNSPFTAPDFGPLDSGSDFLFGRDITFDVDGADQLVLTVAPFSGLVRLFHASRPSTLPPAPMNPLWSIGPAGVYVSEWVGALVPPDPFATKASQAAANIKFPAVLLMEANEYGVPRTTLTIVEDCNSFKAHEGATSVPPPVLPLGWIEGKAVCAPVVHTSTQGQRQMVVQWLRQVVPPGQQPWQGRYTWSLADSTRWSPAPGTNLAASSPWNEAVGGKSVEQLLSEGPPSGLLPNSFQRYKSALSCFALHLPPRSASNQ